MTVNKQQSGLIGAFLIGLGIVWWLNLWWLIWPGVLAAAGVAAYIQRRRMGRPVEAVQAGVWLVGLGLLFALKFFWPGVLFLAGASILLRGRENQADAQIQQAFGRVGSPSAASRPATTQQIPITTQHTSPAAAKADDAPTTGETTRL